MNSSRNSRQSHSQRYVSLYFQVHQPRRLRAFRFFDIGAGTSYFDDALNQEIIQRVANNCYLPANFLLLRQIRKNPEIKVTFSISGVALEQFEQYAPAVLESFRMLAATGSVEFLSETYYHSLAFLLGREEFVYQVEKHRQKMMELLGVQPTVFRNTELIYSDEIGRFVRKMGFQGVFLDGVERLTGHESPHRLYRHPDKNGPLLFLRDYKLSDDIAFRFSQKRWKEWPLTSKKYHEWLEDMPDDQPLVNIAMDYETFGEHQKADTGIFQFLKGLLFRLHKSKKLTMVTPTEAINLLEPERTLSVSNYVSWADRERDLSAWLGNDMQHDAFENLQRLYRTIRKGDHPVLLDDWRYLQISDHFYYMSTKRKEDGNVHAYFSPYPSPYEAFINYMNVITDLSLQVEMRKKYLANQDVKLIH